MATFLQAPLRSRTVGFPESGSDLGSPPEAFPMPTRLKCWPTYTPPAIGLPLGLVPASEVGVPWLCVQAPPRDHQVPRAPSPGKGVTHAAAASRATSRGITPSSSLLRAHAPDQIPPVTYGRCLGQRVLAGCCQPLLGDGPSRRYLRESFSRCLGPYPGAPCGARARFFPQDIGLPPFGTGSAHRNISTPRLPCGTRFRGCSHSFTFRPLDLLATQVAPTAAAYLSAGRP